MQMIGKRFKPSELTPGREALLTPADFEEPLFTPRGIIILN